MMAAFIRCAFMVMLDFPIAKKITQFAAFQQESGIVWLSIRLSIVQVNRGDDSTVRLRARADCRKKIALEVVKDANQIEGGRFNDKLMLLEIRYLGIDCHTRNTCAFLQNFDAAA